MLAAYPVREKEWVDLSSRRIWRGSQRAFWSVWDKEAYYRFGHWVLLPEVWAWQMSSEADQAAAAANGKGKH